MFGSSREEFLRCWYSSGNFEKLIVRSKEIGNTSIRGFGVSIDHKNKSFYIGPIVCDDLKTIGLLIFLKLLDRAIHSLINESKEIHLCVYQSSGLSEILEKFGFEADPNWSFNIYLNNDFPSTWAARLKSVFATCTSNYGPF